MIFLRSVALAALALTGANVGVPATLAVPVANERVEQAGMTDAVDPAVPVPEAPTGDRKARRNGEYHRAADGLFYVTARVNGTSVRFLVDTGSSMVVLTQADAAKVGALPAAAAFDRQVQTANGASAMAWTRLDEVRLAGRAVSQVDAVVTRGGLPVSLLGQNVLGRLGTVTMHGDHLRLAGDPA